jgi:hypothetical protein
MEYLNQSTFKSNNSMILLTVHASAGSSRLRRLLATSTSNSTSAAPATFNTDVIPMLMIPTEYVQSIAGSAFVQIKQIALNPFAFDQKTNLSSLESSFYFFYLQSLQTGQNIDIQNVDVAKNPIIIHVPKLRTSSPLKASNNDSYSCLTYDSAVSDWSKEICRFGDETSYYVVCYCSQVNRYIVAQRNFAIAVRLAEEEEGIDLGKNRGMWFALILMVLAFASTFLTSDKKDFLPKNKLAFTRLMPLLAVLSVRYAGKPSRFRNMLLALTVMGITFWDSILFAT